MVCHIQKWMLLNGTCFGLGRLQEEPYCTGHARMVQESLWFHGRFQAGKLLRSISNSSEYLCKHHICFTTLLSLASCRKLSLMRPLSHITTRFVRLDMKRGPCFGVVYPVSHPTCRIKDSNPNDMSLNSYARTHGCSISFILQIILIN